jgi:hypothetical protein
VRLQGVTFLAEYELQAGGEAQTEGTRSWQGLPQQLPHHPPRWSAGDDPKQSKAPNDRYVPA